MDFFSSEILKNSNESGVSRNKEEAMIGFSEENKDKQHACCRLTGEACSASWMKLMADSNPATQLALSLCSTGEERFKSKNLLRQQSGFDSAIPVLLRAAGSAVPEKKSRVTAQLTIFYDGMVNVYDDISADKAQAIMLLASSGTGNSGSLRSASPPEKPISLAIYNQPTRKVSGLPIAPKQSLQRFLEKRQERRHCKEENVKPSPNVHPASSLLSLQRN